MAVARTGGSCHRSPAKIILMPPKGRLREPSLRFAYGWRAQARLKYTSKSPRSSAAMQLVSSSTSQRMPKAFRKSSSTSPLSLPPLFWLAAAALTGIVPQECTVFPPIRAAIVFCAAKN